tara:strand:+ start:1276 stop:2427 length:1152 start_codon:yes stop_codon:yes gene_type:complete
MEESVINDFQNILNDFIKDLETTFPDYNNHWKILKQAQPKQIYDYCATIYPERFFDILYQNDDIFKEEENINTFFLPSLDFKTIFNDNTVSDSTKKTIWKYLQLILFSIVNNIKDKTDFGESMNIFSGIEEDVLQEKLQETMEGINDFFTKSQDDSSSNDDNETPNMPNFPNMPDIDSMKDHLSSLFNGKIGSLAKEMAEEISDEFIDIMGDSQNMDTKDILKNVMKNPKKIMELMKKVTTKLEEKMKSGNISRDEIMKEASEIMGKMKDMGGGDQFNDLMKNLTKGMGLGKGAKFNKGAFNAMQKEFETKERLREKIKQRKKATLVKTNENKSVFKIDDEEQQKTEVKRQELINSLLQEEESEKVSKPKVSTKAKKKKKKKN